MSSKMKLSRRKQIQLGFLTLIIIAFLVVAYTDYSIHKMIQEKSFLAPTKYYGSPKKFFIGQVIPAESFQKYFATKNYRQRDFGSSIQAGDFSIGNKQDCAPLTQSTDMVFQCILFRTTQSKQLQLVNLDELDQILSIYTGEDFKPSLYAQAEAEVFAQYLGSKPTQQNFVELGEIPRYCLDAVIAIEDPHFLEHQGISFRGLFRAVFTNIKQMRWSQGGSTITQQLVKNYFLTHEKKLSRKIKEIIISLIFEFRVSKDDILETYLNIIYLGQSGVFEVRGYGSASEFYFQKPIGQTNLSDCALLAAIVNSPGRYNPVRHPEKALKRRERVLSKMLNENMISQEEFDEANQAKLPKKVSSNLAASAPYYVDAVNKKLIDLGIDNRSGLNVFTALDPHAQKLAEKAVRNGINYFEKNHSYIKRLKTEKNQPLQAALLGSNTLTGEVVSIVGGRNFSTSPYNRAVESQRQVGSVFKPIVYLTALINQTPEGDKYSPTTKLSNAPLKYEYDGQVWEPQNYDKSFSAPVPLFFALKESMNVPTSRLGIDVGLEKVVQTAHAIGIESTLKPFPSISLGAFELNPLEVLKAYNTISQMGLKKELQIVKQVTNQRGDNLFHFIDEPIQVDDPKVFAVLVGMMKETLISGTGQYARKMGFNHIAAGKTGTTSDTKDAWFAGFTPFHSAVVWVGYDNATSHTLTGASGALPIWTNYMRDISKLHSDREFPFPEEGLEKRALSTEELIDLGVKEEKAKETELIFIDELYN